MNFRGISPSQYNWKDGEISPQGFSLFHCHSVYWNILFWEADISDAGIRDSLYRKTTTRNLFSCLILPIILDFETFLHNYFFVCIFIPQVKYQSQTHLEQLKFLLGDFLSSWDFWKLISSSCCVKSVFPHLSMITWFLQSFA